MKSEYSAKNIQIYLYKIRAVPVVDMVAALYHSVVGQLPRCYLHKKKGILICKLS